MHFTSEEVEALTPSRLSAVLAVAEVGSFSDAAKQLGGSQSQVSRAVAAVESAVGGAIFDRSTRSVRLTELGREFVERVTLLQAELAEVAQLGRPAVRPDPRVVVASLASVSELHLAAAVRGAPTGLGRFRCIEGLQATVEQAVLTGRAIAGFGDLAKVDPGLAVRPMWSEPFLLAVPRRHRFARRRRVALDELRSEPLVGFSREAELRSTLDRELAAARQLRPPDVIVDGFRTALSLVGAGLGVMVVPSIVAPSVPSDARLVALDHPDLCRTIGILHRPEPLHSDLVRALAERIARIVSSVEGVVLASPAHEHSSSADVPERH